MLENNMYQIGQYRYFDNCVYLLCSYVYMYIYYCCWIFNPVITLLQAMGRNTETEGSQVCATAVKLL